MRKRLSFLHVREQGVRNIKEGKMRRSEQIIKAVVWGLCVCLGGYLAARGYLYLRQSPGERAQQILPAVIHGEVLAADTECVHRVDEVVPAVVGQGNGKIPLRAHGDLDMI